MRRLALLALVALLAAVAFTLISCGEPEPPRVILIPLRDDCSVEDVSAFQSVLRADDRVSASTYTSSVSGRTSPPGSWQDAARFEVTLAPELSDDEVQSFLTFVEESAPFDKVVLQGDSGQWWHER